MKKGYIQSVNSVTEFHKIVTKMTEAGIAIDQITVNKSFAEFAETVKHGDVVVVYSLECLNTLPNLMDVTVEFIKRGVVLESLTDSWYRMSPEFVALLKGVTALSTRIRAKSTCAGLTKAKAQGKKLGRPLGSGNLKEKVKEVARLHKESKISIAKACAVVDCNPRSYYRYLQKYDAQA